MEPTALNEYCRHHECQCASANELAWMSERLGRTELLALAVEVHKFNSLVPCRHARSMRGRSRGLFLMDPRPA